MENFRSHFGSIFLDNAGQNRIFPSMILLLYWLARLLLVRPMGATEQADVPWVRLFHGFEQSGLVHDGTGEVLCDGVPLDATLHADGEKAFISSGGNSKWVRNLLRYTLYKAARQTTKVEEFFIQRLLRTRVVLIRTVLESLVFRLAATVELMRGSPLWAESGHINLQPLARVPDAKPRRFGVTFKVAVHRAVMAEQDIRTTGQFFAAMRIQRRSKAFSLVKKVGQKVKRKQAGTGRGFEGSHLKQYSMATKRAFQSTKFFWWSMDGVRGGNKELVMAAVGDAVTELHDWAPPTVG